MTRNPGSQWGLRPAVPLRSALRGLALAFVLIGLPAPAAAQAAPSLTPRESCIQAESEPPPARCHEAALALDALAAGLSLTLSAGGALPTSPSTAGKRLGGSPRIVTDAGLLFGAFRSPDLRAPAGPSGFPEARHRLIGARAAVVIGLFGGFSPAPTVGGVLSLDAVGTARYLRTGDGFDQDLFAWGGGVRLGLLRESFTLPGVTLQLIHLRGGEVEYGTLDPGGAAIRVRPNVTSIRGGIGKDLLAFGIAGGVGYDRITGEGSLAVTGREGEGSVGFSDTMGSSDFTRERRYLFGGVNLTWVVFQIAGEVSWALAPNRDPLLVTGTGPYDGQNGTFHGALTARITY